MVVFLQLLRTAFVPYGFQFVGRGVCVHAPAHYELLCALSTVMMFTNQHCDIYQEYRQLGPSSRRHLIGLGWWSQYKNALCSYVPYLS